MPEPGRGRFRGTTPYPCSAVQTVRATHERCGREVVVDVPDDQDLRLGVEMTCPTCQETFVHRPAESAKPASGAAPARAAVVGLATTSAVSVEDALLGKVPPRAGSGTGQDEGGTAQKGEPTPAKATGPAEAATPGAASQADATAVLAQSGTRTRPPQPGAIGQPSGGRAGETRADARERRRASRSRVLKWIAPALILIGIALLLIAFATQRSPLDTEPDTTEPPRETPSPRTTPEQPRTTPRSDADRSGVLSARVLLRA